MNPPSPYTAKLNAALATLLDDVEEVLALNGSQHCILRGAIVEHLNPVFGEMIKEIRTLTWRANNPGDSHAPHGQDG